MTPLSRHTAQSATIRYCVLVAALSFLLQQSQGQETNGDFTCNLLDASSITCTPQPWQLDQACEPTRREGFCTDCLDCDPCRSYNYDCQGCISQPNCFWCPGDALCSSVALTQNIWDSLQERSEIENNELQPSCVTVEDWQTTTCSSSNTSFIFSDPLFESMVWLYDMIHVEPVWQAGITGKGVHIRVNDVGGVDGSHAEWDERFDAQLSCEDYAPPDDAATSSIAEHGTAVASLALGGANNDQCAVGIAVEATLSACALPPVGNPLIYATIMITHLEAIDISVNSWSLDSCIQSAIPIRRQLQLSCPFSSNLSTSPCRYCGDSLNTVTTNLFQLEENCRLSIAAYCLNHFEDDVETCSHYLALYAECHYDSVLTDEERASLEIGVQQGREGRGIIFVMSAGNGYVNGDSTNAQKWVNSRYTISVGAVDKTGVHASYSSTGASIFVSAPGGDIKHLSNNIVAKVGGGCQDISAGTSFSTPVVAGVIALMLQVNPALTWRDVQGILTSTSQQVDTKDDSWVTNAAGFSHSYKYGFGVVHAQNAVAAAESWDLWSPEEYSQVDSGLIDLQIPEQNEPVTSALTVEGGENFVVESVVVFLDIDHPSRGDLSITLTSPQGTESILHFSPRPENRHLPEGSFWELMTVRAWGEAAAGAGNWVLSISDDRPGNLRDGCVDIPWTFLLDASPEVPSGALVTCGSIGRSGTCFAGEVAKPEMTLLANAQTQLTPDQACCICGGGMAPSTVKQLVSWNLVVYGRSMTAAENSEDEQAVSANGNGDDTNTSANSGSRTNVHLSRVAVLCWMMLCCLSFC